MKKGIKTHEEKALEALLSEFGQIHIHDTFLPQMAETLTANQRKEALQLITMIKEKRFGKVKARACVDGRKQRRYIKKDGVSSPTVQQESLIISMMIDAKERRDVVRAYLLADMNDYVLIRLTGEPVATMCGISKEYNKYVTHKGGRKVLYLKLKKVLYGCIQSAILWYDTFKGCLEEIRFKLNKYDPCVANKLIDGK